MKVWCELVQKFGPFVARVLIAQLFVISGITKMLAFEKTSAFMFNRGMPAADVLLVCAILLEVGGGLLLIAGYKVRWVAAALAMFTFIATFAFHPFWAVEVVRFANELNNFMKNLALMGGLIYVMAYGPGPYALEREGDAAGAKR